MNQEAIFRLVFVVAFVAMLIIRGYYQSRVLRDKRKVEIKEGVFSLVAGSIAALTTIVFGAEYIFRSGTFWFAYLVRYPDWLRWLGVILLAAGIGLLWQSHRHLAGSFHSLVALRAQQELVTTGPYRWVRHPIYTSYLMNYLAGGLIASNWVLTVVPVTMYLILVGARMPFEEAMLQEQFGQKYRQYMARTGRLLPPFKK